VEQQERPTQTAEKDGMAHHHGAMPKKTRDLVQNDATRCDAKRVGIYLRKWQMVHRLVLSVLAKRGLKVQLNPRAKICYRY
jgi:hypothetical protein